MLRRTSSRLYLWWRVLLAPWPVALGWFAALAILGGLAPAVQVWAITHLIDGLAVAPLAGALWPSLVAHLPYIFAIVVAMIVSFTVSMNIIQPAIATYHAEHIVEHWLPRVFEKSMRLRLEQFERPAYFDLLQRARAALQSGPIAAQHSQLQRIVARVGGCVGIVVALASVSWPLAAALVLASAAITRWRLGRSRAMLAIQRAQTPLQRRRDYWRDLLLQRGSATELRLFQLADYCTSQWRAQAQQMQDQVNRVRLQSLYRELPVTIAHTAVFSLSGIGLLLAAQSRLLSPGVFVAMLFAIQQFLDLIQNFSRIDKIHQVVAELTAIPSFLALEGDEPRASLAAPPLEANGVRFHGVQFTYPGSQRPALEGIDMHIRPGERIALVGENGAGKSTLARLLLGLYRPTAGEILVEGVDLQAIDQAAWRVQAAAVFQDYMRYTNTARENIGYGRIERLNDDMAIEAAAQRSGADAVVAQLPQGYATLLGKEFEGGVDLSGGQWQTFAIARAYLRDAALLVLDEPAAALDALAEQEVYRQFLSMSAGKTVLLISHRLGAARLADRIIVLQRGRIAEAGTHEQLLAAGGHYAELYQMQAAWYR